VIVDVALVGFGNVGRRFARLLGERRERLRREHDLECRIVGIATRRHGCTFDARGLDLGDALARAEAGCSFGSATSVGEGGALDVIDELAASDMHPRVVVETTTLDIGAGQPAVRHVERALDRGCHVITANKGPVAFAYRRLHDRASAAGLAFLFESSVMDGIPVFNLVRETLPAVEICGFRGVVNSTTNYILSAMERGEGFESALARMQADGIAEADPSLDLDGWDAAAKTAALANVLMRADITPHDVLRVGIAPAVQEVARAAFARDTRLRLVASASRAQSGELDASVRLQELERGDVLSGLSGMANALVLNTDLLGDVAVTELTGGLTQTAFGVLADLIAIRRRLPA
jgi:homoserine dehydrogenase